MATKKRPARKRAGRRGPRVNLERMVLAAYHTICGDTEAAIAERIGVTDRTIRNWKTSKLWAKALAEAEKRWFPETRHLAMATLTKTLRRGNVDVAKWFAERQIEGLAPPKQKHEHTGRNGGPLEITARLATVPDEELFQNRDNLAKRAVGEG